MVTPQCKKIATFLGCVFGMMKEQHNASAKAPYDVEYASYKDNQVQLELRTGRRFIITIEETT